MICYFDIETLQTTNKAIIADMEASIKPPATYKKQESIDEWIKENKESALAEMVSKTSFDAMDGSLACIAWAFDDGEICATLPTDTESEAINRFYDAIRAAVKVDYHGGSTSVPLQFCGHNSAGFDLPFLKHRSIILGMAIPPDVRKAFNAKPWDSLDTMLLWDSKKMVGMDKLCKVLGIPGKGDFDGSMVNATWTSPSDLVDGGKQVVIDYCKDDIIRTRQIYKRITGI